MACGKHNPSCIHGTGIGGMDIEDMGAELMALRGKNRILEGTMAQLRRRVDTIGTTDSEKDGKSLVQLVRSGRRSRHDSALLGAVLELRPDP